MNNVSSISWPGTAFLLLLGALALRLYLIGVPGNPPGFCPDEASVAYNGYTIAHAGVSQFGVAWPLFFKFEPQGLNLYGGTYIYALSAISFLFGPSVFAARMLSVGLIFVAALLIGWLASRISSRLSVGVIVALMALWTPWLFEVSRWTHEASQCPLEVLCFLVFLYAVRDKDQWSWLECAALALTLALLTYGYAIGRMLAPLLALGLLLFATNRHRLPNILKTWTLYGLTLVPLLIFNRRHPQLLTLRFHDVSYIRRQDSFLHIAASFARHYIANLNLAHMLITGDTNNPRHHVPGSLGSLLLGTFLLAVAGLVLILLRHRRDPWWQYVLYGAAASLVPASLTSATFHTLRLIVFPVFLLLFTVPALMWFFQTAGAASSSLASKRYWPSGRRGIALAAVLTLTLAQIAFFQLTFARMAPMRVEVFDGEFPFIFTFASASTADAIYLDDQTAITMAYWYSTSVGQNTARLIRTDEAGVVPKGGVVISSGLDFHNGTILLQKGRYTVYRFN